MSRRTRARRRLVVAENMAIAARERVYMARWQGVSSYAAQDCEPVPYLIVGRVGFNVSFQTRPREMWERCQHPDCLTHREERAERTAARFEGAWSVLGQDDPSSGESASGPQTSARAIGPG